MRHRLSSGLTDAAVARGKDEFGLDLLLSPPTSVHIHHTILIGLENRYIFPFHAIKTKIFITFCSYSIYPLQSALF